MTGDAYSMLSCSYFNVPTLATTTTSSKGETYFQKEEETEYGMMVRRTAKYYALRLCLKHCWSGIAQIQVLSRYHIENLTLEGGRKRAFSGSK